MIKLKTIKYTTSNNKGQNWKHSSTQTSAMQLIPPRILSYIQNSKELDDLQ